jgi:aquaporin Z
MLMLEFGSRDDFDDPTLEYRRLFSEVLGTFMLVLVAAGGGILHGKGQISLSAAVVAPGLMVLAIILFMGAVSGAHLNPAVSLAFASRGDFPWRRVPGYILAQLLGATLLQRPKSRLRVHPWPCYARECEQAGPTLPLRS